MTDRCKNITFPQTSFAGGNNSQSDHDTTGISLPKLSILYHIYPCSFHGNVLDADSHFLMQVSISYNFTQLKILWDICLFVRAIVYSSNNIIIKYPNFSTENSCHSYYMYRTHFMAHTSRSIHMSRFSARVSYYHRNS